MIAQRSEATCRQINYRYMQESEEEHALVWPFHQQEREGRGVGKEGEGRGVGWRERMVEFNFTAEGPDVVGVNGAGRDNGESN